MAMLMIKQGSVQEELFVPESTLISGFGSLMSEWQHTSKFTFSSELMEAMLILDGMEHPWQDLAGLSDTPLSVIFGGAAERILMIPVPQLEVAVVETLHVVSALDETLEALTFRWKRASP